MGGRKSPSVKKPHTFAQPEPAVPLPRGDGGLDDLLLEVHKDARPRHRHDRGPHALGEQRRALAVRTQPQPLEVLNGGHGFVHAPDDHRGDVHPKDLDALRLVVKRGSPCDQNPIRRARRRADR